MAEPLLPPEVLADAPFTDAELAAFFAWADSPEFDEQQADLMSPPPEDGKDPGPAARFQVDGPRTAAWAMAKYAEYADRVRGVRELRDEFLRRIQDWYADELGDAPRSLQFFGQHLEAYALQRRADTEGKEMTQKLPSGKVATTKTSEKIGIEDDAAVMEWAREHAPTAIKEDLLKTPVYAAARILEYPTRVLMHPCACIVDVPGDVAVADREKVYELATGMTCLQCGEEALVGRWFDVEKIVVGLDDLPVPGATVEPEKISAKVTPK